MLKIIKNLLIFENNQEILNINEALNEILIGNLVIIFPNNKIYSYDIKKYPNRSISSPEVEKSVRGSKDSFTENIIDNIALIRRRIRDTDLVMEMLQVGESSKTDIAFCYMKKRVNKDLCNKMRDKINNIKK